MRHVRLSGPRGLRLDAEAPTTRRERMRGLLGRDGLAPGAALLLERTRSIHTFGMRFEIAAVLLDSDLRILDVRRVRPGRLLLPRPRVRHVLECDRHVDLRSGDRLEITT